MKICEEKILNYAKGLTLRQTIDFIMALYSLNLEKFSGMGFAELIGNGQSFFYIIALQHNFLPS
jgi:hypothetical protein